MSISNKQLFVALVLFGFSTQAVFAKSDVDGSVNIEIENATSTSIDNENTSETSSDVTVAITANNYSAVVDVNAASESCE
jgi:hypothetical protein